jgi:glycogen debranching enzyme GlgX
VAPDGSPLGFAWNKVGAREFFSRHPMSAGSALSSHKPSRVREGSAAAHGAIWDGKGTNLGVTTVELLPIHTFINDSHLLERKLTNYWGYNSIGFFAPDPRYASEPEQCLREFKEMVARFHDAGLEVILDVVYNHTAQGNERGPTLSFKGIDNASYYRLLPDNKRYYINDTGTGNTLNLSHPGVIKMVTDSLRYRVNELHVDGFRFDLGTILAREPNGFDNQSGFPKSGLTMACVVSGCSWTGMLSLRGCASAARRRPCY